MSDINAFEILVEYLSDEQLEQEHARCLEMEAGAKKYGGHVQPYYVRLKAALEIELTQRLLLS